MLRYDSSDSRIALLSTVTNWKADLHTLPKRTEGISLRTRITTMKTRCQRSSSNFINQTTVVTDVSRKEEIPSIPCPHCTVWTGKSTALKQHSIADHPGEVPTDPQCETCGRPRSSFLPRRGGKCNNQQLFDKHRGNCKEKNGAQTQPLPELSNQIHIGDLTPVEPTHMFPVEHHSEPDGNDAPDEIKVSFEPTRHCTDPEQGLGRKESLNTPPVSADAKWKEADALIGATVEAALGL